MTYNTKSLNEFTHSVKRKLAIRPDKSLGQNFLVSDTIRNRILDLIDLEKHNTVIEIGGGLGALSIPIASGVSNFIVYEIDKVLRDWLEKELAQHCDNVRVYGDFLNEYPPDNLEDRNFAVIGNIPYQITSPILERIFSAPLLPSETILMMQREVADRITADCGTKARGRLSVFCDYHCKVTGVVDVDAGAFYPQPKVGSRVLKLVTRDNFKFNDDKKKKFFSMIKQSFSMKRKTLANNLQNWHQGVDKKCVESIIDMIGLDKMIRAECLTLDEFVSLFEEIEKQGN
jgi:16S rRNA (adenine1518-N6/adenine1519-N6)-dimethyltransferase